MTKADHREIIRIDRELIVNPFRAAGFQIEDDANLYLLDEGDPKIVVHGPTEWKSHWRPKLQLRVAWPHLEFLRSVGEILRRLELLDRYDLPPVENLAMLPGTDFFYVDSVLYWGRDIGNFVWCRDDGRLERVISEVLIPGSLEVGRYSGRWNPSNIYVLGRNNDENSLVASKTMKGLNDLSGVEILNDYNDTTCPIVYSSPLDGEVEEPTWSRETGDVFRRVEIFKQKQAVWHLEVWLTEQISDPELDELLDVEIKKELYAISGVDSVLREDRERWIIQGNCEPREVIWLTSRIVDEIFHRLQSDER